MSRLHVFVFGLLALAISTAGFPGSPVFDLHDPGRDLRRSLGEDFASGNLAWLRGNVGPADTLEQTVERAVAAGLRLRWDSTGRNNELDDPAIGEWVALAAAQVAADHFPEAAVGLSSSILDPREDSPVCECFQRRAGSCSCHVVTNGPNACDFSVQCDNPFGHGCLSVEIQRCIASHAIGILIPFPR